MPSNLYALVQQLRLENRHQADHIRNLQAELEKREKVIREIRKQRDEALGTAAEFERKLKIRLSR